MDSSRGTSNGSPSAALVVSDLAKAYGPTQALGGVSFSVRVGEVHGLLGGNGSGKSTAIKCLAGVAGADRGTIQFGGKEVEAKAVTPAVARSLGFRFVHQQPPVFPAESIAENIALGFEFPCARGRRIRWSEVKRRAREAVDRFGLDLDVTAPMGTLRPANQAMVAIVRALQDLDELSRAFLVLDEPTAALPREEAWMLLDALKGYASSGLAILFVTHRLEEVLKATNAVTVLKDGKVSAVLDEGEITHDRLVEGIVGATIGTSESPRRRTTRRSDEVPRLSVRSLRAHRVDDVSLDLAPGEIVGVAGLLGSGRSSLLRSLFGLNPASEGTIEIDGRACRFRNPQHAIRAGLAYVPEDRSRDAVFPNMSVMENISMVTTSEYWKGGWLRTKEEARDSRSLVERFSIKTAGEQAMIGSLSGGNQQKVVLTRWIRRRLKVLLLDEPTQGVDVGARAEIFEAINQAVAGGTSVLMVSSEFEELTLMCSRILILRDGSVAAEIIDPSSDVLQLERAIQEQAEQNKSER